MAAWGGGPVATLPSIDLASRARASDVTGSGERHGWTARLRRAADDAWSRGLAWVVAVSVILALGAIRVATAAEFAFASLGLLPVLLIAWIAGRASGMVCAGLAATTWLIGDIASERDYSSDWIPWANGLTRFAAYGIAVALADQVRVQLLREHERAIRDQLTGLLNRHALGEVGSREVDRSRRYAHPLAVAFIDLDNFKRLNDCQGHGSGDAALRAAAAALQATARSTDILARWGGDEFVLLLPELDADAAVLAGRRISDALRTALRGFPGVSASVGVAWFEAADRPFAELLHAADGVMYLAKQAGKDGLRVQQFTRSVYADGV